MLFSNNMHAQIFSTSWLISLTSAKMDMHSNSYDIQQKDVDGVPHESMVITQQAVYKD